MRHWYSRYRISSAIDEGTLAALRAGGHLSRCPSCQTYARDLETLHARLSLSAASAPAPPAARSRRPLLVVAAPLSLAAAALVALVVASRGTPVPVEVSRPPAVPVLQVRDLAGRVSAIVAMSDAPLDAELQHLIHDGRRGLDVILERSGLRR